MPVFSVTYDLFDDESIEHGDCCESGFISQNVSLRDAITDVTSTNSCHYDGANVEPSDSRIGGSTLAHCKQRHGLHKRYL